MGDWARVAAIAALSFLCCAKFGLAQTVPGTHWQQLQAPADAGWSADKLQEAKTYAEKIGSTSVLIVQHGVIVAAWGDVTVPSNLHSARKSLLNSLIGIAVGEHKIDLDATLAQLDVDDLPPALSEAEKQAKVRDLLEARSGVYHQAAYETEGMKEKRPERGSHVPGSFWYYNNWDFNVLGAIYEKAEGARIFDAFDAKIARPIGMEDFSAKQGHYVTSPVTKYPAYLFDVSARDLARFALLFLHGGNWNGNQIVPKTWVTASTQPYSDTSSGGYGYLWWTGDSASGATASIPFPPGSFWAEGHLGQYAVAVPSRDLVIVNRVDSRLTKQSVSKHQAAHLVKLIFAAAPTN